MISKKIIPEVGDKYKLFFNEDNPNNGKIHVIAYIESDKVYVIKVWGKYKQRWFYKVENVWWFRLYHDVLTKVR